MGSDILNTDKQIENIIKNTNHKNANKINWTKVWSKKYPVLNTYKDKVDVSKYSNEINKLLTMLEKDYNYNKLDAMLILKDILANVWKNNNKKYNWSKNDK